MDNPLELSDSDFLDWAGAHPERWALLPCEKREAWLDHLVACIRATSDVVQLNAYWRLAYTIAYAGEVRPAARAGQPLESSPTTHWIEEIVDPD